MTTNNTDDMLREILGDEIWKYTDIPHKLQLLIHQHEAKLLQGLLGEAQELATRSIIHPDLLEAVPVDVIKASLKDLEG